MTISAQHNQLRCAHCQREGSISVAQSEHPYQANAWVDEITDGFRAEDVYAGSPTVYCEACGRQALKSRQDSQRAGRIASSSTRPPEPGWKRGSVTGSVSPTADQNATEGRDRASIRGDVR